MPLVATLLSPTAPHRRPPRERRGLRAPDPPGGERLRDAAVASPGGQPDAHVRVLIVDDDPLMTDLLPRKLARAVHARVRILTASTSTEAERLIVAERPHVVLSDFNLRESKTGLDVLAHAARATPAAARILFSGHTPHEMGRPLAGADIHGYLEKPMKLDDLIVSLLEAIRQATGLDLSREAGSDA